MDKQNVVITYQQALWHITTQTNIEDIMPNEHSSHLSTNIVISLPMRNLEAWRMGTNGWEGYWLESEPRSKFLSWWHTMVLCLALQNGTRLPFRLCISHNFPQVARNETEKNGVIARRVGCLSCTWVQFPTSHIVPQAWKECFLSAELGVTTEHCRMWP